MLVLPLHFCENVFRLGGHVVVLSLKQEKVVGNGSLKLFLCNSFTPVKSLAGQGYCDKDNFEIRPDGILSNKAAKYEYMKDEGDHYYFLYCLTDC